MSPFWILLQLIKGDGGGATTGTISRAKLQSEFHQQQTNTQFYTGQMPFLSPNQQYQKGTEGKCLKNV